MKNIFVFDVDNTLTPPRQKITDDMEAVFKDFIKKNKVYLVSGSDFEKIVWQLGREITGDVQGVYGCLGNTLHIKNKLSHLNEFSELESLELLNDIKKYINESLTPVKTGNHVEIRIGMINISTIGRNASIEQRKIYSEFDKQNSERKIFADFLSNKYPKLDISIGGEISIDISVKGHAKEQIYNKILRGEEDSTIIFFGDRCDIGGNDHGLAKLVELDNGIVFNVDSYADTKQILQRIWNGDCTI